MKCFKIIIAFTAALFLIVGCSSKKLEDAEGRIKVLGDKGVPDSLLSSVKVHLFQSASAKKIGDVRYYRKYKDSTFITLEKIEADFNAAIESMRPYVETTRKSIAERKKQLSGLQLQSAQKLEA